MNDWPLWDVFITGSLGITREVVKAPTAADAVYRVQWEFDWYRLPNTVRNVERSEDQSQKPDKVYQGRNQSVRA